MADNKAQLAVARLPAAGARPGFRLGRHDARASASSSNIRRPRNICANGASPRPSWCSARRGCAKATSAAGTRRPALWRESSPKEAAPLYSHSGPRQNVIATGGGPGIMEAANRGAHDAGAPSIGYNITLPHEQEPNAFSTPELTFRFHYFAMRKMHFAMRADGSRRLPRRLRHARRAVRDSHAAPDRQDG